MKKEENNILPTLESAWSWEKCHNHYILKFKGELIKNGLNKVGAHEFTINNSWPFIADMQIILTIHVLLEIIVGTFTNNT